MYPVPGGSDGKETACNIGDLGLIPGLGRSPGGGHSNPLQYSCLENPHGQRCLAGYSAWGCKELDTTERLGTEASRWEMVGHLLCGGKAIYKERIRLTHRKRQRPGMERLDWWCSHPACLLTFCMIECSALPWIPWANRSPILVSVYFLICLCWVFVAAWAFL